MWIYLCLLFGIFKGFREAVKKKALEKSSIPEVLFFHALLAFLLLIPFSGNIFLEKPIYYGLILIKSSVVFSAWIFAFYSIKTMPVSLYGVIDLSRVLFSTVLGCVVLHETMTAAKFIGAMMVLAGLLMLNIRKKGGGDDVRTKYVLFAVFSCFLNAVSGIMDKILMSNADLTSGQLQFWYMLYMTVLYLGYAVCTKTPVKIKTLRKNPWIIILSILFVIADRALFVANKDPQSMVTVMTLLKQSSVIVTIILGKLFWKEKNILYKLLCACVVLAGIFIATFWSLI